MTNQRTDQDVDVVIRCISFNAEQHRRKWDAVGIGDIHTADHRLVVLLRELGELSNSIYGKHEHPPQLELIQIAGIAINWLRQFEPGSVIDALEMTTLEHQSRGKQ